jgi:hypothetical protein
LLGAVQGFLLGTILFAIYFSPIQDIKEMLSLAADSYGQKSNSDMDQLKEDMEKSLEAIPKWLRQSCLKVNDAKTEVGLFYINDYSPIKIEIQASVITIKKAMIVLGAIFNSKLCWSPQVNHSIQKASKVLHTIKLIRKHFSSK